MYQTTLSSASTKTASLIPARPGLIIDAKGGGGAGRSNMHLAGNVAEGVTSAVGFVASSAALAGGAVGDAVGDAVEAVGDFVSSIFYVSPGRMSVVDTQVSDDASVEELLSVSRGDAV